MTPLEKMQKDFEDSLEEHTQEIERLNSQIKATSRRLAFFYIALIIIGVIVLLQLIKAFDDGNLPN